MKTPYTPCPPGCVSPTQGSTRHGFSPRLQHQALGWMALSRTACRAHASLKARQGEPQAPSRGLINGTTRTFLSRACPVCLPRPCPRLHTTLAPTCIYLPEGGLHSQPCATTPAHGPAPPPAPPMAAGPEPRAPGVQLLAAAPGLLGGHPGDLMTRGSTDNQEIPKAEDSSVSPHRAHSLRWPWVCRKCPHSDPQQPRGSC